MKFNFTNLKKPLISAISITLLSFILEYFFLDLNILSGNSFSDPKFVGLYPSFLEVLGTYFFSHLLLILLNTTILYLSGIALLYYVPLFFGYAYYHSYVLNPSLFSGLDFLYPYFEKLDSIRNFNALLAFGVLFSFIIFFNGLKNGKKIYCSILSFFLLIFFTIINNPLIPPNYSYNTQNIESEQPNIIVIGIDGLDYQQLMQSTSQRKHPKITKFFANSHMFENSFSNISRTHSSYHSMFKGQQVYKTKVRGNNAREAENDNETLEESHINNYKKNGYNIEINVADPSFSFYYPGKIIDRVNNSRPGVYNLVLPSIIKDKVFFSFFNNFFGRFIAPNIIANQSFFYSILPYDYLRKVINSLEENQKKGPFVSIFHTSQLHWPGPSIFPQNNCIPNQQFNSFCYGYGENAVQLEPFAHNYTFQKERNLEIFKSNVENMASYYLEPLLEYIEAKNLFENSIVVILSDHSESFFSNNLLPTNQAPKHGALIQFEENSNRTLLAIQFPDKSKKVIKDQFGMHNLFDYINAHQTKKIFNASAEDFILENDRWINEIIPAYSRNFPSNKVHETYEVSQKGNLILTPEYSLMLDWQKSTGILKDSDQSKLISTLPSDYGHYFFNLENIEQVKTLTNKPVFFAQKLNSNLDLYLTDESTVKSHFSIHPQKNELNLFQVANENLYYKLQPKEAYFRFLKIFEDPNTSTLTKNLALIKMYTICQIIPNFFKEKNLLDYQLSYPALSFEFYKMKALCALKTSNMPIYHNSMNEIVNNNLSKAIKISNNSQLEWSKLNSLQIFHIAFNHYGFKRKSLSNHRFDPRTSTINYKPTNEFEKLLFLTYGLNGRMSTVDFHNKLIMFFNQMRDSKNYGIYGLMDGWYGVFYDRIQNSQELSKILVTQILKNDPYYSLETFLFLKEISFRHKLIRNPQNFGKIFFSSDSREKKQQMFLEQIN